MPFTNIDSNRKTPSRRWVIERAGAAVGAAAGVQSLAAPAQAQSTSCASCLSALQRPGTPTLAATVQSQDRSAASYNWVISDTVFNGVRDTTSCFGYNSGGGGSRPNTAEPQISLI